jgi:hypothetical protein
MRRVSLALAVSIFAGVLLVAGASPEVSGSLTVDGMAIALSHAYLDRTDPAEPIE